MEESDRISGNKKLPGFDYDRQREFWERIGTDTQFQEVFYRTWGTRNPRLGASE